MLRAALPLWELAQKRNEPSAAKSGTPKGAPMTDPLATARRLFCNPDALPSRKHFRAPFRVGTGVCVTDGTALVELLIEPPPDVQPLANAMVAAGARALIDAKATWDEPEPTALLRDRCGEALPQFVPCDKCHGEPSTGPCDWCDGTGIITVGCEDCGHEHDCQCTFCDGTGTIGRCAYCDGEGVVRPRCGPLLTLQGITVDTVRLARILACVEADEVCLGCSAPSGRSNLHIRWNGGHAVLAPYDQR